MHARVVDGGYTKYEQRVPGQRRDQLDCTPRSSLNVVVIVDVVGPASQHSATVPTPPDEKQCPFVVVPASSELHV